jgi:peptidoglycan L-alanyl-D-glutamate endopeptidase CwlK
MAFALSAASERNLIGVHPDLVAVVRRAIELTEIDFKVGEGVRTAERQRKLVAEGKSKTLHSRHIPGKDGLGKAVDLWAIVDGKITWERDCSVRLSKFVLQAAKELNVLVRWGGDWDGDGQWLEERFFDGPHYELPAKVYP